MIVPASQPATAPITSQMMISTNIARSPQGSIPEYALDIAPNHTMGRIREERVSTACLRLSVRGWVAHAPCKRRGRGARIGVMLVPPRWAECRGPLDWWQFTLLWQKSKHATP